jgi:hypothetical protein
MQLTVAHRTARFKTHACVLEVALPLTAVERNAPVGFPATIRKRVPSVVVRSDEVGVAARRQEHRLIGVAAANGRVLVAAGSAVLVEPLNGGDADLQRTRAGQSESATLTVCAWALWLRPYSTP